jgi:cyclophilin family peptidyl-prolyl cis-trans isomerase
MGSRLDWLLASPDPVLRAITIEAVGSVLADSSYVERGAGSAIPATVSNAPAAGADSPAAGQPDWIALLARQWEWTRPDRVNDETLAIVGQLERLAGDPAAQTILREALSSKDRQVRGQARRILTAKQLTENSAEPPIETGRARAEYATILRWAEEDHQVEIRTSRGAVRIRLFAGDAPLTCWNFVRLAESGFYDRGRWHRIVPDFVAQDGCPRGDGYGGAGYAIRCEINEKRFVTGAVGMALSGKDTGGSQFFICHSPQPHLDGRYTVFGQVVDGMDVVDRLIQGDPIESIRPVDRARD